MGLAAGLGIGGGLAIYEGERQRKIAKRNLQEQQRAQREANDRLSGERKLAAQRERQANQRRPNIMSLLAQEQQRARTGPGATLLSGTLGVPQSQAKLGKRTLLGS